MGFPFVDADAVTSEIRVVARIAADLGGQALERAALYSQERTSREALDRILAVAPRFHQGRTTESVAASMCAEACRTFDCDVAQVWTPTGDEQLEVTWRDPPSSVIPVGTVLGFEDFPGLVDSMRALRPMFVSNAQEHTRGPARRHAQELGIVSSLRIPIAIGAQFERILTLQWEREIPEPPPSLVALARRFADQAGLAIEQVERRRAQEQTRSLQAVTEALAAATTPAEVGAAIVREGVSALGREPRRCMRWRTMDARVPRRRGGVRSRCPRRVRDDPDRSRHAGDGRRFGTENRSSVFHPRTSPPGIRGSIGPKTRFWPLR